MTTQLLIKDKRTPRDFVIWMAGFVTSRRKLSPNELLAVRNKLDQVRMEEENEEKE